MASRSPFALVSLLLVGLGLMGGLVTARWVVHLDRIVKHRFEGRLFRVPSRVFSAPTILYPGLDVRQIDLRGSLRRLGYREQTQARSLTPGSYVWTPGHAEIYLRAFENPAGSQPAREIGLRLVDERIESIRDPTNGRELGAVLLEPEAVGSYYGADREQRILVSLDEVPRSLVDAVLAVEDQRFEEHHGIDWRRIVGAFWADVRSGRIREGGSTLTQQLVKNFFLSPRRTLRRKVTEAVMALLVEAHYDKSQILEAYLNEIYLGQRGSTAVHGVGEASRYYFGKDIQNLDVAESALLAAIIQSPNSLSPFHDPTRAQARRDLVLSLMHDQGRIDTASYDRARAEGLDLAPRNPEPRYARYFLDDLRRQLPEAYGADVLTSDGLRIHSTLDVRLQHLADRALRQGLARLEKTYPALRSKDPAHELQGCIVVIRPQTGEVLALAGGRDYSISQFDRCTQAHRSVGSAFKPVVYAAALAPPPDGGRPVITLADHLEDTPLHVDTPSGVWSPANYDREFHGRVTVEEAMDESLNVATSRLAQRVGIDRIIAMARQLGITSPLPPVPSLAIGTAELTPIELARAYATLASGGVRPEIRTFEDVSDANGKTLDRRPIEFKRVLDPGVAFLTTSLLEGVVDRGTGQAIRRAGLEGPIAGKTGTSEDLHDAWFAGYTPELVTVVWVGFDNPRSLGVPASRAALPIWLRFMYDATGGRVRGAFVPPPDVVRVEIDPESGTLATPACSDAERVEYFLKGTQPTVACDGSRVVAHDDDRGGSPGGGGLFGRFVDWLRQNSP